MNALLTRDLDLYQHVALTFFDTLQTKADPHIFRRALVLIKVQDNAPACFMTVHDPISQLLVREGLKVFDFHPIHVYLNTEDLSRYEQTRSLHHNPAELIKHRFAGTGTRTALEFILSFA